MTKPLTQAEQDELNQIGNATITTGFATGKELGGLQGLQESAKGLMVPSAQSATFLGLAASAPAVVWDWGKSAITGKETTEAGDWVFQNVVDPYGRDVEKYWRPDPNAMGDTARVASGAFQLAGMVPQFFAAPQGRVPALALGGMTVSPTVDAVDQGASQEAIYKIGAINLATNAVGFALPAAWGNTLTKRVATGIGANVAMGAAQREGTGQVLAAEGNENAALYKWNDLEAMLFDAGVGGIFAGKLHYDAVNNQAAKLSPEQRQAVMTEVVNDHFSNQTMPGLPMNKDGIKQHTTALDTAIQQVLNGDQVDISAAIDLNNFLVRPELRPTTYAPISGTGKAAGSYGAGFLVDAEVYGNFDQFRVALESNGRADAKAETSSATGLHQFTEGTWLNLVKKNKPAWANGLSEAELLELRTDPDISKEMVKLLDQDNLKVLANAGLPVNFHTMYAMHHFKPASGKAFAAAAGDVLMSDIISAGELKANPYLNGKTKDQAIANWEARAKKAGAPVETLFTKAALAPEVKQADTFPNGVPKNLPEVEADVREINNSLSRFTQTGADGSAQPHRGVRPIDQGSLPDQLASALRAADEALGIKTTVVRNLSPEVRDFHGTTLADGRVYLNENSAHPVVTVAMHEFGHNLETRFPDLYEPLLLEIERQAKDGGLAFFKYDTKQTNDAVALRELTNNAIGDALSDPQFIRRMADENPTVFQKFADSVIKYLDDLLKKVGLKDYGSDRYLNDVATFRDMLADTLNEYTARTQGFDERAQVLAYGQEIGWEQVGGQMIAVDGMAEGVKGQGGGLQVTGRTKWIPKLARNGMGRSDFWTNRPDGITEATARKALTKFAEGKKLGAAEQRFIDYAKKAAKADEADRQAAFSEYMAAETARREADELFFSDKTQTPLADAKEVDVDGVMRPALNSEGRPIHGTVEAVQNFWRWFGDSKVVDAEGRPLVVYHGTTADFSEFAASKEGIHFGTVKQAAMRASGQGKNLMPAYLKIEDFQRSKDLSGKWASKVKTAKAAGKDGIVYLNRYEGIDYGTIERADSERFNLDRASDSDVREFAPELADSYIVFDPTQIKSATGNNGDFSQSDARIQFSDKLDDGYRERVDIPDMPEPYEPPSPMDLLEMPMADREAAAQMAAQKKAEYEKQLALRQKALSLRAMNRVRREIERFPGTPMEALEHILARNYSVKGSVLSIESQAKAVREDSFRQLTATLKATNPKVLGLFENNEGVARLVAELHGTNTGDPLAKAGAKAFSDIANTLKRRFNRAGGDIGELEDWAMPHSHSQLRAAEAGREQWMADIKPLLNRARYDMSDADLDALLSRAWETIATNGVNKQTPGQFRGPGKTANRGSEARQLHFRDGEAYIAYQKKYGESSPFETITGHIAALSHDIAMIEALGPNPDNAFTVLKDEALQKAVLADPVNEQKYQQKARWLDTLFREVSGKAKPVASAKLAAGFDNWRSLQVASKLGSAAITALTDHGTMHTAAAAAGLPQMKLLANELAAFDPSNPVERARIERMGLGLSTMIGELNRFGNDISMGSAMGKVATATMRVSGLMRSTDARRRAYGVTMMDTIGALTRKHGALSELDPMDNRVLLSKGITEQDFAVWKLAELETLGANHSILTPDAIYAIPDAKLADIVDGTGQTIDPEVVRQQAVTRLLGAVLEEVDLAVVEPGAKERALLHGDRVRGTWKGEILSSVFLFKSFPVTMITKHWARMMSMPTKTTVGAYGIALTASTTLLGMMSMQLANLLQGKDPKDMTDMATWIQALLKGGGLSLFGDYLLQDQTQGGNSIIASLAGPMAGTVEDVYGLTVGNMHEAAQGKDTHLGAELVKFGKNNTPLANLWYTRAATDHLIVNELQEMASPGYLRKMERRAAKNYGDTYFWKPGESTPERVPNMEKALGE